MKKLFTKLRHRWFGLSKTEQLDGWHSIQRWLFGGGFANDEIPFDFAMERAAYCIAGAWAHLQPDVCSRLVDGFEWDALAEAVGIVNKNGEDIFNVTGARLRLLSRGFASDDPEVLSLPTNLQVTAQGAGMTVNGLMSSGFRNIEWNVVDQIVNTGTTSIAAIDELVLQDAFTSILTWLDGGGTPTRAVPFYYRAYNWKHCLYAALRWHFPGLRGSAPDTEALMVLQPDPVKRVSLDDMIHLRHVTTAPTAAIMAAALRHYIETGDLKWESVDPSTIESSESA